MANGYYPPGYFTYHAEGGASSATDVLHWPSYYSGVTIGPGYDMKDRNESSVYRDMIACGISKKDADIIKKGAGKKQADAEKFVTENINKVSRLTKAQKVAIFNMIWSKHYVPETKRIYNNLPSKICEKNIPFKDNSYKNSKEEWDKVPWDDLDNKIMDIAVDLMYQGAFSYKELKYALTKNDPDYLIKCIQLHDDLVKWDKGRKRIPYLRNLINGPSNF